LEGSGERIAASTYMRFQAVESHMTGIVLVCRLVHPRSRAPLTFGRLAPISPPRVHTLARRVEWQVQAGVVPDWGKPGGVESVPVWSCEPLEASSGEALRRK
jgi:hypothetical protein